MPNAISTPIIFPKIVPNDWEEWNRVWDRHKKFVPKIHATSNVNPVPWIGFDIYVKDGYDATDIIKYKCENINCPDLFNSLFDNLDKLPLDVQVVRVLQSMFSVPAHRDFVSAESGGHSFRSILYDDNPKQTWYYQNEEGTRQYLKMPDDTNTWWYDDNKVKHGTEYVLGHQKQLIMYRGVAKENQVKTLLDDSMKQYSEYVIYE